MSTATVSDLNDRMTDNTGPITTDGPTDPFAIEEYEQEIVEQAAAQQQQSDDNSQPQQPEEERKIGVTAAAAVERFKKYMARPIKRISTGYPYLDSLLRGGLGIGEVTTVLSKPFVGKSRWLQALMENNLEVPAAFASLEMPLPLVMQRSMSMWSDYDSDYVGEKMDNNQIPYDYLDEWEQAHRKHYYTTMPRLSLYELRKMLEEAEQETGERPHLVGIDYLELISTSDVDQSDFGAVQSVAEGLKGFAKQEEVALVVLHQAGKTSLRHGDVPHEDSGKYAGYTEADTFIGLWAPHLWTPSSKKQTAMDHTTREQLQDYRGMNLLKARSTGKQNRQGWLVPQKKSGAWATDQQVDAGFDGLGPFHDTRAGY